MAWNSGWDEIFKSHAWGKYPPEEVVRAVARNFYSVPDRSKTSILEVGCGTGANLWFVAREGFAAYGIDGSQVAVDRARGRIAEEGLHADLRVGDATALPYPDATFEGVLDIECLYANSWDDTRRIVSEIHRVLKPNGLLLSKTFMTGTYSGAFKKGYGMIRLTSETEIGPLYAPLEVESIEYVTRTQTESGQRHEVKEWVIAARKRT